MCYIFRIYYLLSVTLKRTADSVLKSHVRLNFVEVVDNRHTIAVPMFAAWIDVNQ